jgi:PhnB protein
MKVMICVKATKDSEAGVLPTPELLAAMGEFNQSLVNAGVLLAAEGLKPSRDGKRVRFSGKTRTVTDGPFTETKELIAGFWLWQVRSIEEAVEWVKRCPNPMLTDSDIDIRPIFAPEDFAAAVAAESKT